MSDQQATLWSVSIDGIVTLAYEDKVPVTKEVMVAAVENLLDIVQACGGAEGFVNLYGETGCTVRFFDTTPI